jgi:hypothetical protein
MGALTIAFDITIVGALALPWVILVVHLFFFEGENKVGAAINWVQQRNLTAVAGVLLFAAAYTLGCIVSRIAQDFFNDDDLYLQVGPIFVRMGANENHILASVYCGADENLLHFDPKSVLSEGIDFFQNQKQECQHVLTWIALYHYNHQQDYMGDAAQDLFGLQENTLLLKGEDATLRLRQLHDQIMVLRGATFNGLVGFALCLFAWGAKLRRTQPRSPWRWLFAVIPALFLILAITSAMHHYEERPVFEPPYMEFSLFMIGIAGAFLLWRPRSPLQDAKKDAGGSGWRWPALSLLSLVLTFACLLGWWATEILYGQQVIYSYDSQLAAPLLAPGPATTPH